MEPDEMDVPEEAEPPEPPPPSSPLEWVARAKQALDNSPPWDRHRK
jgi:hypothetical protein